MIRDTWNQAQISRSRPLDMPRALPERPRTGLVCAPLRVLRTIPKVLAQLPRTELATTKRARTQETRAASSSSCNAAVGRLDPIVRERVKAVRAPLTAG